MEKLAFRSNPRPTLGVEIELAIVDAKTGALSSSIQDILAQLPKDRQGQIKPELMQCYLEINTGVCVTVAQAEADLQDKLLAVNEIVKGLGLRLYWTSSHPFSLWQDQQMTPNDRYAQLLDNLQDIGRQLVAFGLHVHVGVDSGDKAVMLCDRLLRHLPSLLALTCNSPWWNNRTSGLLSHRSKIMESLPTAGLPTLMRNWSEYSWLVNHLVETGFINSIRDIWWDVRPHHNFGTVEVRICDMPGNLHDAMAVAAIIQCLVQALSEEIDHGTYQHDHHPMIVRQNKWRAARYGLDANLVDSRTFELRPARDEVRSLIGLLRPTAEALDCVPYLERAVPMVQGKTWAERQLDLLDQTGDPAEVVRRMCNSGN